jgi:hypothetical protein
MSAEEHSIGEESEPREATPAEVAEIKRLARSVAPFGVPWVRSYTGTFGDGVPLGHLKLVFAAPKPRLVVDAYHAFQSAGYRVRLDRVYFSDEQGLAMCIVFDDIAYGSDSDWKIF